MVGASIGGCAPDAGAVFTGASLTAAAASQRAEVDKARGVLVRAFTRGHNPLQMLNPKAPPAKYGTSQEHVAYDPYTGKPMGIKLLEFVF